MATVHVLMEFPGFKSLLETPLETLPTNYYRLLIKLDTYGTYRCNYSIHTIV